MFLRQLDHGHIMELDSTAVVSRVLMKSSDAAASGATTSHGGQVHVQYGGGEGALDSLNTNILYS